MFFTATKMPMSDIWKAVVGWEGIYSVSDVGRVRYDQDRPSRRYSVRAGAMVPQHVDDDGYFFVSLSRVGERTGRVTRRVNRLVAEAFLGPSPFDGAEVDHVNHRRSDNAATNLEWVTCKENIQRAIKVGLRDFRGERCGNAKLTNAIVLEIRRRASQGETFKAIAADVGTTNVNVAHIATGKTWKHVGGPLVASRDGAERARVGIPNHAPGVTSNRQRKHEKSVPRSERAEQGGAQ